MSTNAAAPAVTIYNDTGKSLPRALLGIIRQALAEDHRLVYFRGLDAIETRAARTRKGHIEVEAYADGSGVEVAAFGRVLVLGVEPKRQACNA